MRFMGFSSKVGRISVFALALTFVASLGIVSFPAEAQAGKRWVYSVKFKCLQSGSSNTSVGAGIILGVQTVVNIYNPTEDSVPFRKHYVIQAPQFVDPSPDPDSAKTDKETGSVGAGLGHAINCRDIVDGLEGEIATSRYDVDNLIEGWVIIEAPKKDEAIRLPILSVCATYQHALVDTSTDGGAGVSIDVECYEPKKVRPSF